MNKYRILTADNEWVYTEINVLDDGIQCPLMDERGKQIATPISKLRPETLGLCICPRESEPSIYMGDIFKGLYWKTHEKLWGIIKSDAEGADGVYFQFSWWAQIQHPLIGYPPNKWRIDDLDEIHHLKIIGNKWQQGDLLEIIEGEDKE